MILTLEDLIAPLSKTEFLAHFRARTVAFVRTSNSQRFDTLLDWDDLNYLVESGVYPIEELQVRGSMPIPMSSYIEQGRVDRVAFSSLMDSGVGLIFNRLDEYVPRLYRLCHQIAALTGEQVRAEAIVTSGMDGARPHFNTEDICVLQIAGSNRWELCGPSIVDSLENMSVPPVPQNVPFFNEVLHVGDLLFVPAGCFDRCECGAGRSMHVCIVFQPPCGREVVTWLTNQLMTDETFNGPLTRYANASALASHEAALKARLIEQVRAWSLAGFLAERAASRAKEVAIHIDGTQNATKGLTSDGLKAE